MTDNRLVFAMPFLMPGSNEDWQTYFQKKKNAPIEVAAAAALFNFATRFTLSDPTESKQIYAIADGMLLCLRKNERLRDGVFDFTANTATVIIKTVPTGALAKAAKSLTLPNYVIYENIDLQTLQSDLAKPGGPARRYVSKQVYQALMGKLVPADKKADMLEKLNKWFIEQLIPSAGAKRKQFNTVPVRAGDAIGKMTDSVDLKMAALLSGQAGGPKKPVYLKVAEIIHKIAHYETRLANHPLLANLTLPGPANFYLRFESWDEASKKSTVFSTDIKLHAGDKTYSPKNTDTHSGLVHFELSRDQLKDAVSKSLFFKIGGTGSETYSTRNLTDINGIRGFIEKYHGFSLGTPNTPLVFRLQIKKQISLQYHKSVISHENKEGVIDLDKYYTRTEPAPFPAGILVTVIEKIDRGRTRTQTLRTNSKGKLDFIFMDAGDYAMEIIVHSDVYDKAHFLPRTHVYRATRAKKNVYDLNVPVAGISESFRFSVTICRLPDTSLLVSRDNHYFNASLYAIKILWETHLWVRTMTRNAWQGMPLRILLFEFKGKKKSKSYARFTTKTSNSAGHYETWIDLSSHWSRRTLVHEIGHCISYQALRIHLHNYATYFPVQKDGYHDLHVISDPNTAFTEGWAEFMCQVMKCSDRQNTLKNHLAKMRLEYIEVYATGKSTNRASYQKWGKSPKLLQCRNKNQDPCTKFKHKNLGNYVEGAFAGALLSVFELFFASAGIRDNIYAEESSNGNIYENNTAFRQNPNLVYATQDFYDLIWTAFKILRQYSVGSDREGLSAAHFLNAVVKLAEMHRNQTMGAGYVTGLRNLMNEFNTVVK